MSSTAHEPADALQVLDFWFRELRPAQWFEDGRKLDDAVRARFGGLLAQARRGELQHWTATPRGTLALILVLDQFSRHVHRDLGDAFASDASAQELTRAAIERGVDQHLHVAERHFLYMPLMHAEDAGLQALSLKMFAQLVEEAGEVMRFAEAHRDQVLRFGRFPHRNAALGRTPTEAEEAFTAAGGQSFG